MKRFTAPVILNIVWLAKLAALGKVYWCGREDSAGTVMRGPPHTPSSGFIEEIIPETHRQCRFVRAVQRRSLANG
jgi:hypothetical protein